MDDKLAVPIETSDVICGVVEARCRCVLAPHDGGAHRCACGGSWELMGDGSFVYHSHPGSGKDWAGPGPDDYLPDLYSIFGW